MANSLKRLNPQLSKLAAQITHQRHREEAARDTATLRAQLVDLINRGATSEELALALVAGTALEVATRTE
jgi:hypothetical protein